MPHAAGQLMQGPHGADGQLGGLAETLGELALQLDQVVNLSLIHI